MQVGYSYLKATVHSLWKYVLQISMINKVPLLTSQKKLLWIIKIPFKTQNIHIQILQTVLRAFLQRIGICTMTSFYY